MSDIISLLIVFLTLIGGLLVQFVVYEDSYDGFGTFGIIILGFWTIFIQIFIKIISVILESKG